MQKHWIKISAYSEDKCVANTTTFYSSSICLSLQIESIVQGSSQLIDDQHFFRNQISHFGSTSLGHFSSVHAETKGTRKLVLIVYLFENHRHTFVYTNHRNLIVYKVPVHTSTIYNPDASLAQKQVNLLDLFLSHSIHFIYKSVRDTIQLFPLASQ